MPAVCDGDMSARLEGQSLRHLVAYTCNIEVRFRRAKDDLVYGLLPAGKEHPPHQPPNLLARKALRIPIGLAKNQNLRQRRFLRR
jgi:hypothetical protein